MFISLIPFITRPLQQKHGKWKINQNAKTITEIKGILELRQLYYRKLYDNGDAEQENELPSDILRDEVEQAIHYMKNNKNTDGEG